MKTKKKNIEKVCCICLVPIKKLDTHYKVELWFMGKVKGTDYAHQACWSQKMNMQNKLSGLLNGLTKKAVNLGILEPENKQIFMEAS